MRSADRNTQPGNDLPLLGGRDVACRGQLAAQVQHLSHLSLALGKEKHFLRSVIDSIEDAIVAFNNHGIFVLCNRKFETLFDIGAVDMAGRDEAWLRKQLSERLEASEAFANAEADPTQVQEETVLLNRSGRAHATVLRWYSGPVLDETGAITGRIAVQRDVTRETEVDTMKTDFISIVSHELRTPMTSIRGYVDLILDGDTGTINDLQRQFLQTVQRNTVRLTAMVNDMLDISRIESGDTDFELRPIALAPVVEQVASEARPQTEAKGLRLDVHWQSADEAGAPHSDRPLPRVIGDHDRLIQVLTNLLSNAVKYTPAPPESPGQIDIDVLVDSSVARIAVRDSGIGIADDDAPLLFDKFFRANNPETRNVDGTGLGLSITRALVEKMGSELHVLSQRGRGSNFWFSLPLAVEPSNAPPSYSGLVVTGDAGYADAALRWLADRDLVAAAAYSGAEAVRSLRKVPARSVVIDFQMPRGDAWRVMRFLDAELPATVVVPLPALEPLRTAATVETSPHLVTLAFPYLENRLLNSLCTALLQDHSTVVCAGTLAPSASAASALLGVLNGCAGNVTTTRSVAEALAVVTELGAEAGILLVDVSAADEQHDLQALHLLQVLEAQEASQCALLVSCGRYAALWAWPPRKLGLDEVLNAVADLNIRALWP